MKVVLSMVLIVTSALAQNAPDQRDATMQNLMDAFAKQFHGKISLYARQLKTGQDNNAQWIDSLRFYLSGESQLVYPIYEAIFNNVVKVELRPKASEKGGRKMPSPIMLPASSLNTSL